MTDVFRAESDLLGLREIPADALYGIHTLRALENFPLSGRTVHPRLVHAYGMVKLAAATVNHELGRLDDERFGAIRLACEEMIAGKLDHAIVVDALQGGAGTSTNMNVNEVLANRALEMLAEKGPPRKQGSPYGDYDRVSPADHVNLHQSTNDTYPTALKVAAILSLRDLEQKVIGLLEAFQAKEKEFAHVVKVGRTQLQDATLTTLGREMGAYADALARDRWRIFKCEERLRVVNLGGTAIGTGLAAPRQYIFRVVERLKDVSGIGLARAENLVEATQNADAFVEVSGIVRALASNLMKIANDLRLMASGPEAGLGEIRLPPRQAGSSIMPGKVNPVIPEAVVQAAMAVFGHDSVLCFATSGGTLELNQLFPLIADSLLTSLDLMRGACDIFARLCVAGIEADEARCRRHVDSSTATLTALVETLGYEKCSEVANRAKETGDSIRATVLDMQLLTEVEFERLTSPEAVMRLGSR